MSATKTLYQGPFAISQDDGWFTVLTTVPKAGYTPNFGMGMIGYVWEECGPSKLVRGGQRSLEDAVEAMAAKPFVDVLYIRCDWRHVQSQDGRLNLHPVWGLALDAARRHGKRVAFRVQMSNPSFYTGEEALPAFLAERVPMISIGAGEYGEAPGSERFEPQYDHPEFLRAFGQLQRLLSERFDGDPLIEFMDLMMYGFWGEAHTGTYRSAYTDSALAERTFLALAQMQLQRWKRTPLAVNLQPDISRVGNGAVQALALGAGEWMRTDSIILDEAQQVEALGARHPACAAVIEDGHRRDHVVEKEYLYDETFDHPGVDYRENAMHHALDAGANYWALWLEGDNVERYFEHNPAGYDAMRRRLGYRLRPSWVWQRKRGAAMELVVGVANDGVAGVPGQLVIEARSPEGNVLVGGALDPGLPMAGRVRLAGLLLPEGYTGDTVFLHARLVTKGVSRPVNWACDAPASSASGGIPVRLLPASAACWRMDI